MAEMTPTEINEAVARKLLPGNHFSSGGKAPYAGPNYSTSIEAAWEIVDKLVKENERKGCGPILDLAHDGLWHFRIGAMGKTLGEGNVAQADTAPMAICLAFLKLE